MPLRNKLNLLLGRRDEQSDPLLIAPDDLPATRHGMTWLVQLRWMALAGQLAMITIVHYVLRVPLPMRWLLVVIAVTAISNVALAIWSALQPKEAESDNEMLEARQIPVLGLVQLLDVIILTVLLALSGGPNNPFSTFYFVNLCLSAVVLPRRWAWVVCAAAILCFGTLFFLHVPLPEVWTATRLDRVDQEHSITPAHWGQFVAFAACMVVVAYFTSVLRDQLRRRGMELQRMRDDAARAHRLEALGTLAAGAAHELANPLGTIAVVAREVERYIERTSPEPRIVEDIKLIKSELQTCRNILKRMSADAGQAMGEQLSEATPRELMEETLEGLRDADRVVLVIDEQLDDFMLVIPLTSLAQALRGIVQNALAASANVQKVQFVASLVDGRLRLIIREEGVGMHQSVLARVGDPFFTTKEPGGGTGLGVFLARAVVERIGGKLLIDSNPGRGTTVTIVLPLTSA